MRKGLMVIGLMLFTLIFLSGCEVGNSSKPSSNLEGPSNTAHPITDSLEDTDAEKTARKIVLGFAQLGTESNWRLANSKSIQDSAERAGITLLFTNAEQQQDEQIRSIRSFIARKVDVIAFAPVVETGWEEVLAEAKAAGIPVIITDRKIQIKDPSLYVTFIGSNFEAEGQKAAKFIIDHFLDHPSRVRIVEIQGTPGSAPAIDRKKGFEDVIKSNPKFQVIASEIGDFTKENGKQIMAKLLKEYGRSVQVLFSHNDDMALGAIEAIEEYGLLPGKDVVIVSVDGERAAFQAMMDGKLNSTVECNPLLGPQLMQAVKGIVAGRNLPKFIVTKEDVFTQALAEREIANRQY